jgi:RNA-binding protein YlmH
MSGPPLWRRGFDAVERAVGSRLEQGVQREGFTDVVVAAKRVQRAVGRRVEDVTTAGLHLLNIPARRDVRRLSTQLTRIEREVRALSREKR